MVEIKREEWESYLKAKMLQAKLDGGPCSIFVRENFGGDIGSYTTDEIFEEAADQGWMEYVGEVEYLNANTEAWKTDMGVSLEILPSGDINCYGLSHLQEMKELGQVRTA